MSGAANEGVFGSSGFRRGGWGPGPGPGPGPGWKRPEGAQNFQGDGRDGPSGWPGDYFAMWSLSRPLLIAATITGFIIWWPVGLALLCVAIWNRRFGRFMFGNGNGNGQGRGRGGWCGPWSCGRHESRNHSGQSSGNQAFDEYKAETLRRLEEEQGEFAGFLDRLRFAKDKAEFDQFMSERRPRPPTDQQPQPEG
jgi:hypothetical protein